jgi:hypothetical protein
MKVPCGVNQLPSRQLFTLAGAFEFSPGIFTGIAVLCEEKTLK